MLLYLWALLRSEVGQLVRPLGAVIVAAAIATTSAAILVPVVVSGGGDPGTANVWMDVGTGTCTRSATPVDYAGSASPDARCGSVADACAAASAGDTVRVQAGSYGAQTTTCDETNWVTYYLDAAAAFSSAGGTGAYQKFIGGTISSFSVPENTADHLWFEATNTIQGTFWWHNVNNITWIGPGGIDGSGSCNNISWLIGNTYNITLKGLKFYDHNQACAPPNDHTETFRVNSEGAVRAHDITFESNVFYGNLATTAEIFITTTAGQGNNPYNLIIRNNFFGATGTGKVIWGQDPGIDICDRWTIEYNTYRSGDAFYTVVCGSSPGTVVRENTVCGTGFVSCAAYPNEPNYHISSSAAAWGAGGATCPATDFDGEARPQGTCDEGADEIAGP